jgi:four helix bundle protein
MAIKGHRDLLVWQKSMDLVAECYRMTQRFPDRERFGLSSQLQRAAVSVPANIAEGHGRKSTGAYLHHLSIANGSLAELETHILIGARLGYVEDGMTNTSMSLLEEVRRMLAGLIRSLEDRKAGSPES